MSDDDDMLAEYDLSAWDAPPPPAGLADSVIDRMGGTDVGISVPVDEHREPRRAWIIGSVAAAVIVLGIGVWSLLRATHHAAPATGGVVAEHARTLSLDTVQADLDAGADVRWKREGDVLRVEQRAGRVAWRVDKDEKLVIDAGAASASVEATGANLGVEVKMNATDARVIGATALTAAAVAIVTVVVYEGHVKVGQRGQTVVVSPGTTYTVNADKETHEAPVVGMAPVRRQKVAILGLEALNPQSDLPVIVTVMNAQMRAIAAAEGPFELAPNAERELLDEKLLNNCASEAMPCMAAIGANLGVDMLVFGRIEPVKDGFDIKLKLLDVGKKQLVRTGNWVMPSAEAEAEGLDRWSRKIYLTVAGVTTATAACDAEALKEEGLELVGLGQHVSALTFFEESYLCKPSQYVAQLAFMESCAASESPAAKRYYKLLSPAQQIKFAQMCIRTGTAYEDDVAAAKHATSCDEVSCVLTNYDGACCDKFRRPTVAKTDVLTRADVTNGIAKVRPAIEACGDNAPEGGSFTAKVEVNAKGTVTNVLITKPSNDSFAACAKVALEKATFRATANGGAFSYPFTFKKRAGACDATKLKQEGDDNTSMGQHAAALAKYEAAMKCKSEPALLERAFMSACASQNATKAKLYYKAMSEQQQQRLAPMCIRNGTPYQDSAATSPNCDAEALKEAGMENISNGQHAAALAKFEASLKCKHSAFVVQLAFMESCASANSAKAKLYYKQLTRPQQQKFKQMCERNKVDYDFSDAQNEHGFLQLSSKPAAKVLIDGVDTGKTTPISSLEVSPGRHKVTFVVGGDRFTYSVEIAAGETVKMFKDLQ
jgi:hypothetical protein